VTNVEKIRVNYISNEFGTPLLYKWRGSFGENKEFYPYSLRLTAILPWILAVEDLLEKQITLRAPKFVLT
jgi:hypothetical protein